MTIIRTFCIVVALFVATIPQRALGHDSAQQRIAAEVLEIFTIHCAACHDAAGGKSKGGFGHVLDLARLGREQEVMKPGEPEGSELFLLVESGEMPEKGEKLTPAEVETVRHWIAMGAPAVESTISSALSTDAGSNGGPQRNRFITWVGRFHPSVVHFPIALLVAAAIAQLLRHAAGLERLGDTARFCTALGALGAVCAALLGWADAGLWGNEGYVTAIHRWMGTATAAWALVTLFLGERYYRHPRQSPKRFGAYHLTLYLGAVLVLATSFFGGAVVRGIDHYAW